MIKLVHNATERETLNTLDKVDKAFNYTMADGKSVPYRLNSFHRSDCCSFRAYFKVTLTSGRTLLFCNHHFNVHRVELKKVSTHIVDESTALIENRLQGSEN